MLIMAVRLISRQKFIPGGFRFFQPEINFRAQRNASFDVIVNSVIRARAANPAKLNIHKWSLDYNIVANEVDEFNSKICQAHGWDDYIQVPQLPTVPKAQPPNQAKALQSLKDAAVRAKELVAGAKTLIEWIDSGDNAVGQDLANHRAIICSTCPKNEPGDFTKWFTVPAAELIRRQVQKAQTRSLSTVRDEQLNLCTACHCPLRLKVHVPIDWITKRISPDQMTNLRQAPACWIPAEIERR